MNTHEPIMIRARCARALVLAALLAACNMPTMESTDPPAPPGTSMMPAAVASGAMPTGMPVAGQGAPADQAGATATSAPPTPDPMMNGTLSPPPNAGGMVTAMPMAPAATPAGGAAPPTMSDPAAGNYNNQSTLPLSVGKGSHMRKVLSVSATAAYEGLDAGTGYLSYYDYSSEYLYLTIPITNNSQFTFCDIWVQDFNLQGADGIRYDEGILTPLSGSVAAVDVDEGSNADEWRADCLGPGETGWLLADELLFPLGGENTEEDIYDAAASLTFHISADVSASRPDTKLEVTAVVVDPEEERSLTFTVTNVGNAPVTLEDHPQTFLALDAVGEPLAFEREAWLFSEAESPSQFHKLLMPGEVITKGAYMQLPTGTAELRVFLTYKEVDPEDFE